MRNGLIAICIVACGACGGAGGATTQDAGVEAGQCDAGYVAWEECVEGYYRRVSVGPDCEDTGEAYWCQYC